MKTKNEMIACTKQRVQRMKELSDQAAANIAMYQEMAAIPTSRGDRFIVNAMNYARAVQEYAKSLPPRPRRLRSRAPIAKKLHGRI